MPQVRSRIRRPAPVSEGLQQIGERIRKARVEAGLSQGQLGAPHFTRAYISAIELGKVRPAMKSLEFLAEKLGKPAAFFMEDADAERRRQERAATIARSSQLVAEGKAAEAIDMLEPLLAGASGAAERAQLQRALGRAYVQAAKPAQAVSVLDAALRHFVDANDADQIARTRVQLGSALLELRSYAEAQAALESALSFMSQSRVKDPLLKAHAIYNLGISFYMRGDFKAAAHQFERAEREGADAADTRWQAGLYAGIGMSYLELRDYEAAVNYLRRSEALFEAINNHSRAIEARLRAALSLRGLGQIAKANELLENAYLEATRLQAERLAIEIRSHQGMYWAQEGRTAEGIQVASESAERARALGDPLLVIATQLHLARALRLSDPARAEKILRAVVNDANPETGLPYGDVLAELSEVLSERGLAEEALRYSKLAFAATRKKYGGGE
jgi:tetratricopeptide (TPR) repeat protein